ncbi:eCIS core domain-containing protein [Dactylosporangium sp. McL0621]|uniref:eCIS core domain-containing protein n=1 Tax=Dactylosporangium sp. McL0621 TaxID=3415678 RepID=UPI003CEC5263
MSARTEPDTLGRRLDGLGRRIAGRHDLAFPWAEPLGVLLDHLGQLPSPAGPRFHRRETTPERPAVPPTKTGRALPADVTARLRPLVGDTAGAVRVHDDDAADARARAHRADAVSVGNDVYFRAGKLRPREPRGFALLVHEATHVVERMRPGAAWRRATTGGAGEEERLALAREERALAPDVPRAPMPGPLPTAHGGHAEPAAQPVAAHALGPAPDPVAAPAGYAVSRPMTASADRTLPSSGGAALDLEALKAGLLRDLIGQLRDEFERGG